MNLKKFFISIAVLCCLGITVYFGGQTAFKFIFNDFLYITPNLENMSFEEAERLLGKKGFNIVKEGEFFSTYEKGRVYSQLPKPGSKIKKDRLIKVWTSKGVDGVSIPELKGTSLFEAKLLLKKYGLNLASFSYTNDYSGHNVVIATNPEVGTFVARGSDISLLVNMESVNVVKMPDILGMSLEEAENELKDKKLILGKVENVANAEFPEGTVIDSKFAPGSNVEVGSIIDIKVTKVIEEVKYY